MSGHPVSDRGPPRRVSWSHKGGADLPPRLTLLAFLGSSTSSVFSAVAMNSVGRRGRIRRPQPHVPTPDTERASPRVRDAPSFLPRDVSCVTEEAPMLSLAPKSLEFLKSDMLMSVL